MLKLKDIYFGDLGNKVAIFNYTDLDKKEVFDVVEKEYDLLNGKAYWSGDIVLAARSLFSEINIESLIERVKFVNELIVVTEKKRFKFFSSGLTSESPFLKEKCVVINLTEAKSPSELIWKFEELIKTNPQEFSLIQNKESLIIDVNEWLNCE